MASLVHDTVTRILRFFDLETPNYAYALRAAEAQRRGNGPSAKPSVSPQRMIQAEARVWATTVAPLEILIGDQHAADVASNPKLHQALDGIDFTALREFLETVGHGRALT